MSDMDTQRTADIIEKMRLARIGEYAKWEIMLGKLENGLGLDGEEFALPGRHSTNSSESAWSLL